MSNALLVLQMVLPVIIMLGLGSLCKMKNFFNLDGLNGIKSFISKIAIPVVLFAAFYSVVYTFKSIVLFVVIFFSYCLALGAGFLVKRFVGSELTPFLLTAFEAGMLGYALFVLLVGVENRGTFAIVDLGQALFVYTVYLAILTGKTGGKPTFKSITRNMMRNPAFLGAALGTVVGITGLGTLLLNSPIGPTFSSCINFITAPTAGLILIIVGYELSLNLKTLKPVLITIALRLIIMTVLLGLSCLVVFAIIPFDKTLLIALILMYSLPAPFIIPLYAKVKDESEYIATTLSVNTLVTIAIFVILAIFTI